MGPEFGLVNWRCRLGGRRAAGRAELVVVQEGFSHVPSQTDIAVHCVWYNLKLRGGIIALEVEYWRGFIDVVNLSINR